MLVFCLSEQVSLESPPVSEFVSFWWRFCFFFDYDVTGASGLAEKNFEFSNRVLN